MDFHRSPDDHRFFDIQDFDPEQHRVGPVGVYDGVRINTVLILHGSPGIAFMYTTNDKRGFICLDQQVPQTLRLRDKNGQWHTHTFDPANYQIINDACLNAIRKITGG